MDSGFDSLVDNRAVPAAERLRPATAVTGLVLAAAIVAWYAWMFPFEYRHPIDKVDVLREAVNFFGVLAVAILGRHDIKVLNAGLGFVLVALWMEVIDEFVAEPLWAATYLPAFFSIVGLYLITLGVREARRERVAELERRSLAEAALRRSLSVLRAVVETTPDAVWVKGGDGRYLLANGAFQSLVGKDEKELIGRGDAELFASESAETRGRAVARALESGATERFEATVEVSGASHTFLVSRSAFKDESGVAIGVLGIARDISDRKAFEEKLLQQVHHDSLTGLPNRASFLDRLTRAQGRWRHRPEKTFAVLFIDIDHFKDVNDRFGHAAGDELLVSFASSLSRWLRPGDLIARMSGDEFTVLLGEVAGREDAAVVADRILEGLRQPFLLRAGPVTISASIGVALCTAAPDSAEALVHAADSAMYEAKRLGKARHVTTG